MQEVSKDKREQADIFCVIPLGMAWSCCLFYLSRSPTTSFTKISFQHHAFFFVLPHQVLVEMKNLGYDVLCCLYKWSNRYEADFRDVAPQLRIYSILCQMPYRRIVPTLLFSKFQRRNRTSNHKWWQVNICYLQFFNPSHNRIRSRVTKPRSQQS